MIRNSLTVSSDYDNSSLLSYLFPVVVRVNQPSRRALTMAVRIWLCAVAVSAILPSGCSGNPVGPGDIALPLVGSYTLESRSLVAQDSAATTLWVKGPPELRGSLVLNRQGRYGHADTLGTTFVDTIFVDTGRWSVSNNQFFTQSDTRGSIAELYKFDRVRLIRTIPDQPASGVPSGFFKLVDVWRKH